MTKLNTKNLNLLKKIKEILEDYSKQGIKVTLRQLYYQLVSKDIILNKQAEYHKLSRILTIARKQGDVDWNLIEDRIRKPNIPNTFENINELLETAIQSYRLDYWKEQDYYLEVWTEKDALSSVIEPICNRWQVPFVVNRGYSSISAMFESAQRLKSKILNEYGEWNGKTCIILYLGDYDPSGLDMIRDIKDRLEELGKFSNFEVIPIALTEEQIKEYNPPPNPAKVKDPRAKWYFEKHGKESWEVDALNPEILQKLIEGYILNYLDMEKFNQVKEKEKVDIQEIKHKLLP